MFETPNGQFHISVAGNHDDFGVRIFFLDFLQEFYTVHTRHFDIGQNNLRFGSLKNFKGLFTVFGSQHLIAAVCQRYTQDLANARFVICQQYFFVHDISPKCEV